MDCVYIIRHPPTGMFYIGCTNNLRQRKYQHYSDLRKGQHANKWMQLNYGFDKAFTWETIEAEDKKAAQALEKKMIHENESNELMMNIQARPFNVEWRAALSKVRIGKKPSVAHREAVSAAQKGIPLSDEHKASITKSWTPERRLSPSMAVTINGVTYRSTRAAGRALDVSRSSVSKRCMSDEPMWCEWKFTPATPII